MNSPNQALVTGAAGFLGRHVAQQLSRNGWRVVGIGHGEISATEQHAWGISSWQSDDVTSTSLARLIEREGAPQLVFHGAGGASVGKSWDDPLADFDRTVVTTAAVIETIRRYAPRAVLVYPSSAAVYGNVSGSPLDEDAALAPMSPYGANKLIAERMCLDAHRIYGLRCAVIRFFSIYGPQLRKQLLWDIVRKLLANPEILMLDGDGSETRDFMFVEDAARVVACAAQAVIDEPIIVNGASGRETTVEELARRLIEATGKSARVALRFSGNRRRGDPLHLIADVQRLRKLGYEPQWRLEDGIRRFANWAVACVTEAPAEFPETATSFAVSNSLK